MEIQFVMLTTVQVMHVHKKDSNSKKQSESRVLDITRAQISACTRKYFVLGCFCFFVFVVFILGGWGSEMNQ